MPKGGLGFWTDIAPEAENDFNEWYRREHIPERVDLPGFLFGRRYKSIRGGPKYLALYETRTVETFTSDAYIERLNNPTGWTQRIMPHCRNSIRTIATIRVEAGRGMGGVVAVYRMEIEGEKQEAFVQHLGQDLLPTIVQLPNICSARLWQASDVTNVETREKEFREPDAGVDWTLIVEGSDDASVREATDGVLAENELLALGVQPGLRRGAYRLLFGLHAQ